MEAGGVLAADTGVARAAWLGARPAGGGRPPGFLCLITTLLVTASCLWPNFPAPY